MYLVYNTITCTCKKYYKLREIFFNIFEFTIRDDLFSKSSTVEVFDKNVSVCNPIITYKYTPPHDRFAIEDSLIADRLYELLALCNLELYEEVKIE